eukprot:Opistho-2@64171
MHTPACPRTWASKSTTLRSLRRSSRLLCLQESLFAGLCTPSSQLVWANPIQGCTFHKHPRPCRILSSRQRRSSLRSLNVLSKMHTISRQTHSPSTCRTSSASSKWTSQVVHFPTLPAFQRLRSRLRRHSRRPTPPPSTGFGAGVGGGDFQSLFDSLQFPTASFDVPIVPQSSESPQSFNRDSSAASHVSYGYDGSPVNFVPSPHGSSSPPESPDDISGSFGMNPDGEWKNRGVADRVSSHKASEQRSREKLKQSIQELVLSIPTLSSMKNPSKATIIKKATDFVNHAKKTNSALLSENQRARQIVQD